MNNQGRCNDGKADIKPFTQVLIFFINSKRKNNPIHRLQVKSKIDSKGR